MNGLRLSRRDAQLVQALQRAGYIRVMLPRSPQSAKLAVPTPLTHRPVTISRPGSTASVANETFAVAGSLTGGISTAALTVVNLAGEKVIGPIGDRILGPIGDALFGSGSGPSVLTEFKSLFKR